MMSVLSTEGCLYQQDVVDYLVKQHNEQHLKENADGNQALSTKVINKFRVDSGESVVWVKPYTWGTDEMLRFTYIGMS